MSLVWIQRDAYSLVTEPRAFTIAKIFLGDQIRYELWDRRNGLPAELIGWHASAAAAKAEAEELMEGDRQ